MSKEKYQGSDCPQIRELARVTCEEVYDDAQLIAQRLEEPDLPFFRLDPDADTNGTALCCRLDDAQQSVVEGFEPRSGYWDDEKGYDGQEWTFVDQDGNVFNCYRRWGQMRVGTQSGLFNQGQTYPIGPFIEFLNGMAAHQGESC